MKKQNKKIVESLRTASKNFNEISYLLGYNIIKKVKDLASFTVSQAKEIFSKNFKRSKIMTEKASRELAGEMNETYSSLVSVKKVLVSLFKSSREEAKQGFFKGVKYFFSNLIAIIKRGKKYYKTLWNIASPILSLIVLIATVNIVWGLNFGLSVEIEGEVIGKVKSESVYESAEKMLLERIVYQDEDSVIDFHPVFKLAVITEKDVVDEAELTDRLLLSHSSEISEAYGFYVDNKFEGAVLDTTPVDEVISAKLDSYKTGAEDEVVSFLQDVRFVEGYYLNTTITTPEKIINVVNSEVAGDVYYTVQSGDTPISIAYKNGISYPELQALNPSMSETIYPGSQLLVSAKVPYLNISVKRTEVYNVSVAYKTITKTSDSYYSGYSFVSVSGKSGVNKVTADVTYIDGVETARSVTDTVVVSEPVSRVIVRGTKTPPSYSGSSGEYLWPVGNGGGFVSCHYGGYVGHTGMDIATPIGTPIYAVKGGTVVAVGSKTGGLGKYIAIDHGNGVTTWYGHNSMLYVKVGQYVTKGEVIALSGNTGRSTGPHLHIAFMVNGSYVNPKYYLGSR